jgi:hypothetical protein
VSNDAADGSSNDVAQDAPADVVLDVPLDVAPDVPITGDGGGCTSNADCSTGDFCEKTEGDCGGTGMCMAKPFACPLFVSPVCGCDKKTYTNYCYAQQAGVSLAYGGGCE